jgi:DNA-directed RNA polymerase specialized sigma54-like protein
MPSTEQIHTLSVQQAPSPLMQRSLQILQASLSELKHLVGNEMRANPTLEEIKPHQGIFLCQEGNLFRSKRNGIPILYNPTSLLERQSSII